MKIFIPLLTLGFLNLYGGDPHELHVTEFLHPAEEGRSLGEIKIIDIRRGESKVYSQLEMDRNNDGEKDSIYQMFYVAQDGGIKGLLNISNDREGRSTEFYSVEGISVSVIDQDVQ